MKKLFLEAGKIVGTHGIKGMVRVQPWSDSGEFLTRFQSFFLDSDGEQALRVKRIQPHGGVVLIEFDGVDTIEAAEAMRGKTIYIDRRDAGLPEGRYFVDDLIGCTVLAADEKTVLGTLSSVSQTGANDVWHITRDQKEYLVPAVEQVIISVDIDSERIVLDPMKGIFDDEN